MFGLKAKAIVDNKNYQSCITDGYNLLVKYRHVYAGTGNWLKVSHGITSYSYNYCMDMTQNGNSNQPRKNSIGKFLRGSRQNTRVIMKKWERNMHQNNHYQSYKETGDNEFQKSGCKIRIKEVHNRNEIIGGEEKANQLEGAANEELLLSNKCELDEQHEEYKTPVKYTHIDSDETVQQQNGNHVQLPQKLQSDALHLRVTDSEENLTNGPGCRIDHKKCKRDANSKHNGIDKCCTIMNAKVKITTENQLIPHQLVKEVYDNSQYLANCARTSKSRSAEKGIKYTVEHSQLCNNNNITSTKKSTSLLSRLSQEAQAAMQEAKKEMNDEPKNDTHEDITQSEILCSDSEKDTNDCFDEDAKEKDDGTSEWSDVNTGKVQCACQGTVVPTVTGSLKTSSKVRNLSRSTPSGNSETELPVSLSFDTYKPGTKQIKNVDTLHNGITPLSILGKEGTFVITPAGYDSRFTDHPVMLNTVDETPQQIKEQAILKCSNWLFKHT